MLRRLVIALVLGTGGALLTPQSALADTPVVGQCHQLTTAIVFAISDPSAPVPCDGAHNSLTVAVLASPVPLAGLSDDAVAHVATQACYPAYWQALGGTPAQQHLSDFVLVEFAPTADERAAGANWFRCDVGLANGASLAALPTLGTPVMPQPLPRSLQRCETARHQSVPCSRAHAVRAVKAFRITGHPGTGAEIFRQAQRHCRGVAWVSWSVPEAWALGDHWATCFVRTTR